MPHGTMDSSRKHSITPIRWSLGQAWPLVAVAVAVLAAAPVAAAVYKWTDASGRVVYSDQPPPGNAKVETLNAPPPPSNPNAAKELAEKNAELRQRQSQRAESEKKADQARTDAQTRRTQCVQVQGHIGQLSATQEIVYRVNEKGERIAMDDATRRKEIEQLELWLRENCAE